MANLRAAGFPPELVRRIMRSLVVEQYDQQRLAVREATASDSFWDRLTDANFATKVSPEMRKIGSEQTATLKELFGAEIFAGDNEDDIALFHSEVGNISPEKLNLVYPLVEKYGQQMNSIYLQQNAARTMTNADRDKLASFDQELKANLSTYLSPQEISDFMMRATPQAYQLRTTLIPFQASEAEYQAIYPLYAAFQNQFPSPASVLSPADADARKTAEVAMEAQVTQLLGANRGADFQQATNPDYAQLNRVVDRLGLPISAAEQVAALQQSAQQAATALRADPTVTGAARTAQLQALQADMTAKVSTALGGDSGLQVYKEYGGQWLQNLAPKPKK